MAATGRKLASSTRPRANLTRAIELLHASLRTEQRTGVRFTPILWGAPGQGKTAIVEGFVDQLNETLAPQRAEWMRLHPHASEKDCPQHLRHWQVLAFRLSQCDPTDLKGVPLYEEVDGKSVTSYAPPKEIPTTNSPNSADGFNVVLFLDEISQAVPTMQNLASNIIDGKVGDHLIDIIRCFIVGASNRAEDLAATFQMPMNVANRCTHIDVTTTYDEWQDWAMKTGQNPYVIGYLKVHTGVFNEAIVPDVPIYGTPRSWHKVSSYMNAQGNDFYLNERLSLDVLAGTIGAAAADFFAFCKLTNSKYSIDDIMAGKKVPIPEKADTKYSLVLEATARFNLWCEAVIDDPSWMHAITGEKRLSPDEVTELFVKKLGKEKVNAINNTFAWFGLDGNSDPAFHVLLNKYQSEKTKSQLRAAMLKSDHFKPAQAGYAKIQNALQRK